MCLACEMDALWFAEMEAARAAPRTAGAPPAASAPSPQRGEVKKAGETPAVQGSGFRCEETGSQ